MFRDCFFVRKNFNLLLFKEYNFIHISLLFIEVQMSRDPIISAVEQDLNRWISLFFKNMSSDPQLLETTGKSVLEKTRIPATRDTVLSFFMGMAIGSVKTMTDFTDLNQNEIDSILDVADRKIQLNMVELKELYEKTDYL